MVEQHEPPFLSNDVHQDANSVSDVLYDLARKSQTQKRVYDGDPSIGRWERLLESEDETRVWQAIDRLHLDTTLSTPPLLVLQTPASCYSCRWLLDFEPVLDLRVFLEPPNTLKALCLPRLLGSTRRQESCTALLSVVVVSSFHLCLHSSDRNVSTAVPDYKLYEFNPSSIVVGVLIKELLEVWLSELLTPVAWSLDLHIVTTSPGRPHRTGVMTTVKELVDLGRQMGLDGDRLREFVTAEQARLRDERQMEREEQ
ncbi:hypothetical protein E2C01_052676 [Portunus trituberculatus]|uniref:Uncharacterized protein n=1 Tax=Portunus trituberculatus TaxID=210409 RepID=A0A5B7GM50_PORTR|nr:hypothetical protein [Portunus trituberculatus]